MGPPKKVGARADDIPEDEMVLYKCDRCGTMFQGIPPKVKETLGRRDPTILHRSRLSTAFPCTVRIKNDCQLINHCDARKGGTEIMVTCDNDLFQLIIGRFGKVGFNDYLRSLLEFYPISPSFFN